MIAYPPITATLITKFAFSNVHQQKIVKMDMSAVKDNASNLVMIQTNAQQMMLIVISNFHLSQI